MRLPSLQSNRRGFTLLELMVAIVVMTIAMSIAYSAFTGSLRAWKRGMEVIDGMKHGDFAMARLAAALNSTIYFNNPRATYAFTIEKETVGGFSADIISFVTSSGAFMPHDSPFASGPHRIKLYIDDDDGEPALFATAMPAVANPEEVEEAYRQDPVLISKLVQGLEALVWDDDAEDWSEEWDQRNSVPERVLVSVWVRPDDPNDDPIILRRVLEIPVAPSVKDRLSGPTITNDQGGR